MKLHSITLLTLIILFSFTHEVPAGGMYKRSMIFLFEHFLGNLINLAYDKTKDYLDTKIIKSKLEESADELEKGGEKDKAEANVLREMKSQIQDHMTKREFEALIDKTLDRLDSRLKSVEETTSNNVKDIAALQKKLKEIEKSSAKEKGLPSSVSLGNPDKMFTVDSTAESISPQISIDETPEAIKFASEYFDAIQKDKRISGQMKKNISSKTRYINRTIQVIVPTGSHFFRLNPYRIYNNIDYYSWILEYLNKSCEKSKSVLSQNNSCFVLQYFYSLQPVLANYELTNLAVCSLSVFENINYTYCPITISVVNPS